MLAKPFTFAEKGELYSEGGPGPAFHDTVSFSHVFLIHDNALQWRWKLISDSNKNDKFSVYERKASIIDLENIYCFVRKEEIQDALTNKKSLCCKSVVENKNNSISI